MSQAKKTSHLGAGLLVGSMIGIAAGFFLQSKQGKGMVKDAEKQAKVLQGKLMKSLKNVKGISKAKYEEMVDTTMDYYSKSKDVAEKDMPEIRKFLMKKWKEVEKHMKDVK